MYEVAIITSGKTNVLILSNKGRGRIRPQIGPLTFLKIFVLQMIHGGKSQHSEPSYIIGFDHFHVSIFLIIRE